MLMPGWRPRPAASSPDRSCKEGLVAVCYSAQIFWILDSRRLPHDKATRRL